MNKIKYDSNSIKFITLFESMTGARVKDCILNEKVFFIIEENSMGKAIGRNGSNIKRIEAILRKRIKLAEFSNDVLQLIKNIVYPVEINDIANENGVITIQGRDTNTKAMLIGRDRQNINHVIKIVKRYFDVKEIKVV